MRSCSFSVPDGSAGSRVRQRRRSKGSGLEVRSDGKLRTHFDRDAHWTPGLRIDGTPERARLRQELAVALAPDFGEAFERESSGFADPCAEDDFIA